MSEAIFILVFVLVGCFALIGIKETFFPKDKPDHSMDHSYKIAKMGDRQKWGGR